MQVSVGSSIYAGTICAVLSEDGSTKCKIRWQWSGFKPSWVNSSDILDLQSMGMERRGRRISKRERSSTPLPAYDRTVAAEQQKRLNPASQTQRHEMSSGGMASANSYANEFGTVNPGAATNGTQTSRSILERRMLLQEDFDVLLRDAPRQLPARESQQHKRGRKRPRSGLSGHPSTGTASTSSLLSIRVGIDPPAESMSRWLLTVAAATAVPSLRSSLVQKLCLDTAIRNVREKAAPTAADFAEAYRRGWAAEELPFVFRQVGFLLFVQLHCDGLLCGADRSGDPSPNLSAPPGSVASARLPALLMLWNACLLWQAVPPSVWLQGWLPLVHSIVLLEWARCTSAQQQDAVIQRMVITPTHSATSDGGRLPASICKVISQSMHTLQHLLQRVRLACRAPPLSNGQLELPCSPAAAVWTASPASTTAAPAVAPRQSSLSPLSDTSSMLGSTASTWVGDLRIVSPPRRSQHTQARVLAFRLFDTLTATQMSPGARESGLDVLAQRLAVAAHAQCVLAGGRLAALSRAALCVQGTKSCVPQLLKSVPCDESSTRSAFDQLISGEHTAKCLLTWHRCKRQDSKVVTAVLSGDVLEHPSQWAQTLASCEQVLPGAPPAYHQFRSGLPDSPIAVERPAGEWHLPHSCSVLDTVEATVGCAAVCAD